MTVVRGAVGLLALLTTSGCAHVVDGAVHAVPGMAPSPVTERTVNQILLGDRELQKTFGQDFENDPAIPARFGDDAFDDRSDISAPGCAQVVGPMQKHSYEAADVRGAAKETWWDPGDDRRASIIDVEESVVVLPTSADADALLGAFSTTWDHCQDKAVSSRGDTFTLTGPRITDSILSADTGFSFDTDTIPACGPRGCGSTAWSRCRSPSTKTPPLIGMAAPPTSRTR